MPQPSTSSCTPHLHTRAQLGQLLAAGGHVPRLRSRCCLQRHQACSTLRRQLLLVLVGSHRPGQAAGQGQVVLVSMVSAVLLWRP